MKPTEQLVHEHAAITRMLDILEESCLRLDAGAAVPRSDLEQILEFFTVFVDKCHHAKEEQQLFPALEAAGIPREHGPIGVMLTEHDLGRTSVQAMKRALAQWPSEDAKKEFLTAARMYRSLLLRHILKENSVLFPLADQHLTPEEEGRIIREFDRIEAEDLGSGTHEKFHALLDAFAKIYRPEPVDA